VSGALYLDSSALVKLIVSEPESEALVAYVGSYSIRFASILALVEVPRALARAVGHVPDRAAAVLGGLTLVTLDARIAARAAAILPAELRSLDAIHLATAVELMPELEALVTYDTRLGNAAVQRGLQVVAPR